MLRWWPAVLVAAGMVGIGFRAPAGAGQEPPKPALERKDLDKHIYDTVREVVNTGAVLYNNRDTGGCYRLFQGALMAIQPLLDHYPDLQKIIAAKQAEAERTPLVRDRAFVLREALLAIREKIKPGGDKKPAEKKEEKKPAGPDTVKGGGKRSGGSEAAKGESKKLEGGTLWERLGGEANVKKVVDDFVALVGNDARVNVTRNGKFALDEAKVVALKTRLVELISEASGGPLKYTGKSMKEVHKGMGITDAEFDATLEDLKKALEKNGAKPADVQAALAAAEATRKDIVEGKQSGDKPDEKGKDEEKKDKGQ
jgi:hemoglobin